MWEKPVEIGYYALDPTIYPSNVSRFFGRGELKNNTLYSAQTDTVFTIPTTPLFIATDGLLLDNLMTTNELTQFTQEVGLQSPNHFIAKLGALIEQRKDNQKDDITILLRT